MNQMQLCAESMRLVRTLSGMSCHYAAMEYAKPSKPTCPQLAGYVCVSCRARALVEEARPYEKVSNAPAVIR